MKLGKNYKLRNSLFQFQYYCFRKYVLISRSWETTPRKSFVNDIPTYDSFSRTDSKFRSERWNSVLLLLKGLERGKGCLPDFNFCIFTTSLLWSFSMSQETIQKNVAEWSAKVLLNSSCLRSGSTLCRVMWWCYRIGMLLARNKGGGEML